MKYYFAPMEGVTGFIYRNAYHKIFNQADKYFTPFISPNQSRKLTTKELNDILPEHNQGAATVPQILTNKAEHFIWAAGKFKELGYNEVNFNLGCPSRTVVSKDRGSGFLAKKEELGLFLDAIFLELDMKISIKTRIGKDDPEEFMRLMEIYNRYPLEELIIHPRIQTDYYKNKPNLQAFKEGLTVSKNPVCYNGDIFTEESYQKFVLDFPEVGSIMLGRGLLANPGLVGVIKSGSPIVKEKISDFHNAVYEGYQEYLSGERNVLFKMKELWYYMGCIFTDATRYLKKIKKAQHLKDYEAAVSALFKEQEIIAMAGYQG